MPHDTALLKKWHAQVADCLSAILALQEDGWPPGISHETVFMLGVVCGELSKSSASLIRDIARRSSP